MTTMRLTWRLSPWATRTTTKRSLPLLLILAGSIVVEAADVGRRGLVLSERRPNQGGEPDHQISVALSRSREDEDDDEFAVAAVPPSMRISRAVENEKGIQAQSPRLITVRLTRTHKDVSYGEDGEIEALSGKDVHLNLYGIGLDSSVKVKLTTAEAEFGDLCKSELKHYVQTESFSIGASEDGFSAYLRIPGGKLPLVDDQKSFHFCLSRGNEEFVHQGVASNARIKVYQLLLPVWLMIVFISILLTLSGIFSGLNLGLMSLDQTELKIVQNTGTENEKMYANKIAPIRKLGNYLLCTLLLGNVLVNNTLTILLDALTSGVVAVIGATMGIVIFGEIIPQAICSRHGLAVGAYTIWLTKFFMLLTFPLAFPISKMLDKILGAEIGTVYDKKKLIELLRVTNDNNDLEKEEVDIVTGALVYKDKKVRDVMTKLEDVHMLPLQAVLDFETVSDIRAHGYSRIPIYDGDRKNIVHILFAKDLMFIDPDDEMPVSMVCEFYSNDVNFTFHDTPLNIMFNEFKSGDKGHMAFVQEINTQGDGDPFYETIGLITLEDIIEEIIQQEIVDETDCILDNKTKKRRKRDGWQGMEGNFQIFNNEERKYLTISPQLALAVFQYLTTSIEPFKFSKISDPVLKKLLTMDVFREIKFKKDRTKMNEKDTIVIQKGAAIDFFVLIIEGRVEVTIGPEELIFESGPFAYFGIQALINVLSADAETSSVAATNMNGIAPAALARLQEDATPSALRKNSTHNAAVDFQSSNASTSKRNSIVQLDTPNNRLNLSSSNFIPSFVPDYTVKAISDVLYLRIRRATYIAAIKASQISNKKAAAGQGEMTEGELDNLMEKIAEDNADFAPTALERTSSRKSPERDDDDACRSVSPNLLKESLLAEDAATEDLAAPVVSHEEVSLELIRERSSSLPSEEEGAASALESSQDVGRDNEIGNGLACLTPTLKATDERRYQVDNAASEEMELMGSSNDLRRQ